ncbi:MAG: TRAP transporter small permease subunit [Yoonia sp.]|uniref:TRAP transporter small permease n=1 Tax=Rhodobacterales TaxID=204455 RepID=UPI001FF49A97|nr:TRAP transporter small permease subunit [Loktanella sp. F6476L]MCK0121270.1 TRAP transporter small permease subunit [Loktanella sp. F6476L]UWQ99743.1 TRAP transporter small permease subunit [Rhodobacteraceae bacterium S2214]
MSLITEALAVVPAIFSGSAWEMRDAFYTDGMWLFCFFLTIAAGFLGHYFFRFLPFMDRHLERGIAVATYIMIAAIICWGVIDRFVFSSQWSGSTTVPPFLFMIMAWFGCSYNVRLRTHLSFNEFRNKMSRNGQMAALTMDTVLWFGFCWIAITTSLKFTAYSADNFQLVDGVDNTMKWWFYITVPVAFGLMSGRVFGNWIEDWKNYKSGDPILKQAVIGGDV